MNRITHTKVQVEAVRSFVWHKGGNHKPERGFRLARKN